MGITQSNTNQESVISNNNPNQVKAFYQGECDDQGRHNGKGIMKYSDGSIFEGIFNKGSPSQGLFCYPNGNIYKGHLKDNKPNGKGQWKQQKGTFLGQFLNGNFVEGQVFYTDHSYYKGKMIDSLKHGIDSQYRFKDGDTFHGQFRADQFYFGKYVAKDKDMQYEGFFNNQSQKHGKGKLFLRGVAQYEGQFRNDQFDGQGTLKNLKSSIKYQGKFRQGKKYGYGKLFGPDDKLIYEGQFIDNQKHGKGIFFHQKKKYQGEFVGGKFQGQGILHYGDGDVYKGAFRNNKKHGKGQLVLQNNVIQSYRGDFVQDKFEGFGQVIYSNGDSYKGAFRNNKKHGKGIYHVYQSDLRFEGEWVDDIKNGYFSQTSLQKGIVINGNYKIGQKDGQFQVIIKGKIQKQNWIAGKKLYS